MPFTVTNDFLTNRPSALVVDPTQGLRMQILTVSGIPTPAVQASCGFVFNTNAANNDSFSIGVTGASGGIAFKTTVTDATTQVQRGATAAITAQNMVDWVNDNISPDDATAALVAPATCLVTANATDYPTVDGNDITVSVTSSHITLTVAGDHFTGGQNSVALGGSLTVVADRLSTIIGVSAPCLGAIYTQVVTGNSIALTFADIGTTGSLAGNIVIYGT